MHGANMGSGKGRFRDGETLIMAKPDVGVYRRLIKIKTNAAPEEGRIARAALEDDFHHFRVEVNSADGEIKSIKGSVLRHPTTLCPGAAAQLQILVGLPLSTYSYGLSAHTDARQQCTHLMDLAGLAVAALGREISSRTYIAKVDDENGSDHRLATLERNGEDCLEWHMQNDCITYPQNMNDRSIGKGFTAWATSLPSADASEAALVLRRAVFVSVGRAYDLDIGDNFKSDMGGCWVWQPERADMARRNFGSSRDFTNTSEALLTTCERWLAFEE